MGSLHASGTADITVASVQSITSGSRLEKFDPAFFKLILVDEAHHIVASRYLDVLDHFGVKDQCLPPEETRVPALIGVSATFSRFDGRALGQVIDRIVYHKDYVDMIGEKWLSNVIFTTVESGADIRKVGNGVNGDFQPGALSRAINTPEVNEITVRSWMAKAVSRKSTLVFCVDLNHVTSLTAMFRRFGFEAQFVTGDTPKKIRSERLDAFRNGDFPVLLNCGVFTEGTDIPNIDCVLLARPTKSRNLLVQMIGRGMRLHVGKENCHIIDMVTSLNTGIVSTPTLFGLDPAAVVENATVDEMENLKERKEQERRRESEVAARQEAPLPSSKGLASSVITFTDYDSVAEMIEDTAEERLIRQLSQFAWVCVGDNRYVLSSRDGGHLAIELGAEGFMVKYIQKLPSSVKSKSPFARPRHVAKAGTLEHAVHAADTFAADVFDYNYIGKHQFWRRQPASEKQLAFLNKFRDKGSQLMLESCSKGKAADMITKLKHGARGRHERSQVQKRNVQKMIMKDQQLKELADREHVRVGPIRIPSHASAVEG